MAEQFTPLPETDVIDGEVVDRGYNPADWAELNSLDRQHEREAMAAIAQQPLIDIASSGREQRARRLYQQYGEQRPIGEQLANLGITVAGGVGDLVQIGGDVLAHLMVARSPEVPFTTERLREKTGVRPAEQGQLLLDLLAPGPAEIVKAGSIGVVGIRNLGKMDLVKEAEKLIDKGLDNLTVFRRTGMYEDSEGGWKYWKVDRDLDIDLKHLEDPLWLEMAVPFEEGEYTVTSTLGDLIDDDELFTAYPQLRKHKLLVTVVRDAEGNVTLGKPGRVGGTYDPKTGDVTTYSQTIEDIKGTIWHEIHHMTDTIEGLTRGDNAGMYHKIVDDWHDAVIENRILRLFEDGTLDPDKYYLDPELSEDQINSLWDIVTEEFPEILRGESEVLSTDAYRSVEHLAQGIAKQIVEDGIDLETLQKWVKRERLLNMSRMRSIFSELVENGIATEDQVTRVIQSGPQEIRKLTLQRYYNNAGELRAYWTDAVRNIELKSMPKVPVTDDLTVRGKALHGEAGGVDWRMVRRNRPGATDAELVGVEQAGSGTGIVDARSAFSNAAIQEARGFTSGNSKQMIVEMTPKEFLELAEEGRPIPKKTELVEGLLEEGTQFDQIPMLQGQLRQDGDSVAMVLNGHEGRHRARALVKAGFGDDPMPVRINQIEGGDVPVIRQFEGEGIDHIISENDAFDRFKDDAEIRNIMIKERPFPRLMDTSDQNLSAPAAVGALAVGGGAAMMMPSEEAEAAQETESFPQSLLSYIADKRGFADGSFLEDYAENVAWQESRGTGPQTIQKGKPIAKGKYQVEGSLGSSRNDTIIQRAINFYDEYPDAPITPEIEYVLGQLGKDLDFSSLSEETQDALFFMDAERGTLPLGDLYKGVLDNREAWIQHWNQDPNIDKPAVRKRREEDWNRAQQERIIQLKKQGSK